MKVKICGITNPEDAKTALEHGAHAIGFILNVPVDTPRKISLSKAVEIIDALGERNHAVVAVMMNSRLKDVEEVYEVLKPDAFQFHGNETPLYLAKVKGSFDAEVIKTIHITEEGDVDWEYLDSVAGVADYILLDTKAGDKTGGTGKAHNWDVSLEVKRKTGKRIILSGGLSKENIIEAVRKVQPHWVDLSSSLEASPGKKDHQKIREFMEALRDA